MYVEKETLLRKLPQYRDEWITITPDQNVHDIIDEILDAHKEFAPYYDKIALYFDADTIGGICDNLYNFCKENISYHEEMAEDQTTALPAGILTRGYGDCKHYASFCGGILGALNRNGENIDWNYRFASYRLLDSSPHHVFIVVHDKERNKEIWIDPTPGANQMTPYWQLDEKIKLPSMALNRNIAGIGDTNQNDPNNVSVNIPKGSYLVWIKGQWYLAPQKNKMGALTDLFSSTSPVPSTAGSDAAGAGLTSLVSTAASAAAGPAGLIPIGLGIISSIASLFKGGPGAMDKIYKMFPLPPNATIGDVEQILDGVNQHWAADDYNTADNQWRDAYNALINSYAGVLRTAGVNVKTYNATQGYPGPLVVYSNPENITYATSANVAPTANPNAQQGALLGGSNNNLILIAVAAVLLLSGSHKHSHS